MKKYYVFLMIASIMVFACNKKTETEQKATESKAEITAKHRCANCGMDTEKYPNWEQKVVSEDKGTMYFDGARCMFKVLLDSAVAPKQINQILVKDYYSLEYTDGKNAFYVIGSDVLGPMGNELIPFTEKNAAEEFLTDHKGEKIVMFDEVDMPMIMKLAGKMKMKQQVIIVDEYLKCVKVLAQLPVNKFEIL